MCCLLGSVARRRNFWNIYFHTIYDFCTTYVNIATSTNNRLTIALPVRSVSIPACNPACTSSLPLQHQPNISSSSGSHTGQLCIPPKKSLCVTPWNQAARTCAWPSWVQYWWLEEPPFFVSSGLILNSNITPHATPLPVNVSCVHTGTVRLRSQLCPLTHDYDIDVTFYSTENCNRQIASSRLSALDRQQQAERQSQEAAHPSGTSPSGIQLWHGYTASPRGVTILGYTAVECNL